MTKYSEEANRIWPYILPKIQRAIPAATNGGGGGGTSATSINSAISAAIASHASLDFVQAHPTDNATTNKHETYYSYNFGIRGGTGVDESDNILAMLDTVGENGGGVCILSATNPADPVLSIEKTISIYYDNVQVVFDPATRVSMGEKGCLRVMGSLDEYTRKVDLSAMKLHVASTVNGSNQTILELSAGDTALMDAEAVAANRIVRVGDKIVVRGQNDLLGKALEKDTTFVVGLAKVGSYWQVTCSDELGYTFQPTYPSSDWPPDATTGTTIYIVRHVMFSGDLPAGSWEAVVSDVTGFAVGDVVMVLDSRTEHDVNASALKGDGSPYKNPGALEILRIIAVDVGTNTLGFDRATVRTYEAGSPWYGGVSRCLMVRNSSISGATMSYHAVQTSTSYNPLQLTYAVECAVHHCRVEGRDGRAAHGCRMSYALNCQAYENVILDCYDSSSGRGYGITDYYSTGNQIYDNVISGCRHNILLQLATNSIIHGNESRNHLISGIDLHGVNSYGTHIYGNTCTQVNETTVDSTKASGIRIGNTSHTVGDHYVVVEDNLFVYNGGVDDMAFDVIANSSHVTFRNNTVYNATIGFKFTLNSSQVTPVQTATAITLEGNHFYGCVEGAIFITGQPVYDDTNANGKMDDLRLINNISDGNSLHWKISGDDGITNVLLEGNIVLAPVATTGEHGIEVSDVAGLQIIRNNLHLCNKGISLSNCTDVEMVGNILTSTVDDVAYTDGGGNTITYQEYNTGLDVPGTGGGGGDGWRFTRADGALSAGVTTTSAIIHNNATPVITDGLQMVTTSYSPTATSNKIEVTGFIPYIQASVTGPVQVTLWAGSTPIAATTQRITTGGSSGGGIIITGDFVAASTSAVTIQMRCGPDVNTTTLTFNNKFNGLAQPYLQIEETGTGGGGGGGGAVDSVNSQTGTVVLDADDIDDSATTHKWATAAELSKLSGIATGAEVNVNADWTAVAGDALILNKPADMVTLTGSQTMTNKTLTAPIIADFTAAAHDHADADDGGQLDHGLALAGLGDDDHTQYYNQTRGDARYGRLAAANAWTLQNTFSANTGFGTTDIESTHANFTSLQLGSAGYITFGSSAGQTGLQIANNLYYDGDWKWRTTAYASLYGQNTGQHIWYTVPSGTIDTSASSSFVAAMRLTNDGYIGIGSVLTPFNLLHVQKSAVTGSDADANDFFVIENNGHTSMNIIAGTASVSQIVFSDDVRARGLISYNHSTDGFTFRTAGANAMTLSSAFDLVVTGKVTSEKATFLQSSTTGTDTVIILSQSDLSEEFLQFNSTVGAGNAIDTAAIGTYYGKLRVSVNGTAFKYIPIYNT